MAPSPVSHPLGGGVRSLAPPPSRGGVRGRQVHGAAREGRPGRGLHRPRDLERQRAARPWEDRPGGALERQTSQSGSCFRSPKPGPGRGSRQHRGQLPRSLAKEAARREPPVAGVVLRSCSHATAWGGGDPPGHGSSRLSRIRDLGSGCHRSLRGDRGRAPRSGVRDKVRSQVAGAGEAAALRRVSQAWQPRRQLRTPRKAEPHAACPARRLRSHRAPIREDRRSLRRRLRDSPRGRLESRRGGAWACR